MSKSIDPADKRIAEFMKTARVLVADMNSSSRPAIRRLMSTLGAKAPAVVIAESYEEAVQKIERLRPNVIFSDFSIGTHSCIELFDVYLAAVPDRLRTIFLVLTPDNSPSTVTAIADADVDAVLLRPLSLNDMQVKFLEALAPKLEPSPSMKALEASRRFYVSGKFEEAAAAAVEAQGFDAYNPGAHAAEGLALQKKGDHEGAFEAFSRGLAQNKAHYRCLVGVFELLLAAKKYNEAYEAGTVLSTSYPLSPRRIPDMVRLCVLTERYSEMLQFYDAVSALTTSNESLTRYVTAGLVVSGKALLVRGKKEDGLNALRKAELISKFKLSVVKDIMIMLYSMGFITEGDEMAKRHPPEIADSEEVQLAVLEQVHARGIDANSFLHSQTLILRGFKNPRFFEIAIQQALFLKRPESVVQDLVWKASAAVPEKKEFFEGMMKSKISKAS